MKINKMNYINSRINTAASKGIISPSSKSSWEKIMTDEVDPFDLVSPIVKKDKSNTNQQSTFTIDDYNSDEFDLKLYTDKFGITYETRFILDTLMSSDNYNFRYYDRLHIELNHNKICVQNTAKVTNGCELKVDVNSMHDIFDEILEKRVKSCYRTIDHIIFVIAAIGLARLIIEPFI